MREEDKNEMLEADDKYEAYRLGFKRGADRGYDRATRQSERDIVVLQERIVYLGDLTKAADREIKAQQHENMRLQKELDDKIQRIVVLRHSMDNLTKANVNFGKKIAMNSVYGIFGRLF